MFPEKRRDLPRVDCLPGQLGNGVVPAREPHHIEIDSMRLYLGNYLTGKIERKSQIVTGGDETHRTLLHVAQTRNEGHRTNRLPEFAQLVNRQVGFYPTAHVLCRDSLPNNIGNVT